MRIVRSITSKVLQKLPNKPNIFNSIFKKRKDIGHLYFDSRNAIFTFPLATSADQQQTTETSALRHKELKLVCTELDRHGHLSLRKGLFSKSSLCSSLGLQARDLRKLDGYASNQEQTDIYNPIAYLNTFVDITIYGHGDRQKLLDSVYKTVLDSPSAISKIVFKCDYIGCDKERDNFEDLVQFKCTNTNCNLELDFCRTHSENFQCFRCESMCELFATNPEISNHDFQIKD